MFFRRPGALEVDHGRENRRSEDENQPFEAMAGEETGEVQNQNDDGDHVEQREQPNFPFFL